MAIPGYQGFMLPLLKFPADRDRWQIESSISQHKRRFASFLRSSDPHKRFQQSRLTHGSPRLTVITYCPLASGQP